MTCISDAGKYREFHKLYSEGEYHAAGDLLLALLQARLAPKQSVLFFLAACHNINKFYILKIQMDLGNRQRPMLTLSND